MNIKLYDFTPSRSVRCRWILEEVGQEYEVIEAKDMMMSGELKKLHPLGKVPVAEIDGNILFESAAICTYIADQFPEKNLIAKPGTWSRALHEQWVSFCLTEMEAWLWSAGLNSFVLPEEERQPAVLEQSAKFFSAGAQVLDDALAKNDYLIDNKFSVTDIIVGFAPHWADWINWLDDYKNLQNYLERLYQRPNCTFKG